MKLVSENIGDVLRPKNDREIEQAIESKPPYEIIKYGITLNNPNIVKKGIDLGGDIDDIELKEMIYEKKWKDIATYYFHNKIENEPKEALRLSILLPPLHEFIFDLLDETDIDFSISTNVGRRSQSRQPLETYADAIIAQSISNLGIELIKEIYNHPKINPHIKAKHGLLQRLIERHPSANMLDLILKK